MLDQIQIAKPCPANWDEMKGDDAVRHCSLCRLNVYNLSAMTESEIEKLLGNAQGRVCGRLYRREDGNVITKDCPRGVRAFRVRVVRQLALAASFVLTLAGCGERGESVKKAMGVDIVEKAFKKEPPALMGAIACPPPSSTSSVPSSSGPIVMGEIAAPVKSAGGGP